MLKGLKSLIAGVLAGTAIGVMFSPKKGDEIRKEIKDEVEKGGSGLKAIKDTVVGLGKRIGESAKDAFEELSETEAFQEGEKRAKTYAKQAKKKANKIIKEKTTPTQRKKVKKAISSAKKTAKKAINKAASTIADKTE